MAGTRLRFQLRRASKPGHDDFLLLNSRQNCLLHRLRQFNWAEKFLRIEIIFSGFTDYPKHAMFVGRDIADGNVFEDVFRMFPKSILFPLRHRPACPGDPIICVKWITRIARNKARDRVMTKNGAKAASSATAP